MFTVIKKWSDNYLSDPEAVVLLFLIAAISTAIFTIGDILIPVLASIILAFVLQAGVHTLERFRVHPRVAVYTVYAVFLAIFLWSLLVVVPDVILQLKKLFDEFPNMLTKAQVLLNTLPEKYPDMITLDHVDKITASITQAPEIQNFGRTALAASISKIPSLVAWMVYLILVPIMLFFFLKDATPIQKWIARYLPANPTKLNRFKEQLLLQMGNYLRGKVLQGFVVGGATYVALKILGMPYAMVLSLITGLTVLVPYVGAVIATFPVVVVGLFHWGLSHEFGLMLIVFLIIQVLDAYVSVPIIFSGAVNLHPLATLTAIVVFGGIWGTWGVFFAIPLALLIRVILEYWPRSQYR